MVRRNESPPGPRTGTGCGAGLGVPWPIVQIGESGVTGFASYERPLSPAQMAPRDGGLLMTTSTGCSTYAAARPPNRERNTAA